MQLTKPPQEEKWTWEADSSASEWNGGVRMTNEKCQSFKVSMPMPPEGRRERERPDLFPNPDDISTWNL